MKIHLFALAAAAILANPQAAFGSEADTARLVQVSGNVIVSHARVMASVDEGHALPAGARVLVTGNGRAVVRFPNGCKIPLEAGAHFEVPQSISCAEAASFAAVTPGTRREPRS